MLTIMGITADSRDMDIAGTRADVRKVMGTNPRRIAEIIIHIYFQTTLSDQEKLLFEKSALSCPVHRSLHPDTTIYTQFHYSS